MFHFLFLITQVLATPESSVEIKFVRGTQYHKLLLASSANTAEVTCYKNKQMTRQSKIDKKEYLLIHDRAQAVVQGLGVADRLQTGACRTPFVITVNQGSKTERREGCRTSETGEEIGNLIQLTEKLTVKK